MNFFEKISALLIEAIKITDADRKAVLVAVVDAVAAVQRAALRFDSLVGTPGASQDLGEGLIALAGLFSAAYPQLSAEQKTAVKEAIRKTVDLPDGNEDAEEAAEAFFSTLVDALAALNALAILDAAEEEEDEDGN